VSFIFTKQKVSNAYYDHYYSPTPLGESWATEKRMSNASESEAALTRGQRAFPPAPLFPFAFFQKKEGTIGGGCAWVARITYFFHSSGAFIFTKQKVNNTYYDHYYSPTPLGESWATEKGMSDASESEAALTRGQRASA
jgi:hypothetical protein